MKTSKLLERNPREHLADILRDKILSGEIQPGSKLESVRETARKYKFSLPTVIRAIEILSDQGYLISRERQGNFVSEKKSWKTAVRKVAILTGVVTRYSEGIIRGTPYLGGMVNAQDLLGQAGYRLSLHGCVCYPYGDNNRRMYIPPKELGLESSDAILSVGVMDLGYLGSLYELGKPVVVYDLDTSALRFDSAFIDHAGSAYEMTCRLIETGRKNIVFLGAPLNSPHREIFWNYDPCVINRAEGYSLAMRSKGLQERLYYADWDRNYKKAFADIQEEVPDCDGLVLDGAGDVSFLQDSRIGLAHWITAGEEIEKTGLKVIAECDFSKIGEAVFSLLETRL